MSTPRVTAIIFAFVVVAIVSPAQTLKTFSFDGTNGQSPSWPLVQGVDGNFYGSTQTTIFRITPAGTLTTLQTLLYSHLSVQGTDGNFYGTTPSGGTLSAGTVFKMSADGTLTTLYSFCAQANCTDGELPYGGVIQGADGNFYGTTSAGGAHSSGTVYRITPAGQLTTLCSFPSFGMPGTPLVQGSDGSFYGTTADGGPNGYGTVFKVSLRGILTTLHTFNYTDGASLYDGLIQGADGNFYGTTYKGGANDPLPCAGIGCGTIFKMTPKGVVTTLYNFCALNGCADGQWPSGGLVQATDGNLYGTTQAGGAFGTSCPFGLCGTVFKITPQGELTILHSFDTIDGSDPYAGLLQGTDGNFYGNTQMGAGANCGGSGCGSLFILSSGLGPFVETRPAVGKVGETITIVGNHLRSAQRVSFNGTASTFKVISTTEIKAVVPNGATTGTVEVTTPGGTLKSNVEFRVIP